MQSGETACRAVAHVTSSRLTSPRSGGEFAEAGACDITDMAPRIVVAGDVAPTEAEHVTAASTASTLAANEQERICGTDVMRIPFGGLLDRVTIITGPNHFGHSSC